MKIGIIVAMDKEFTQLKTLLTESQTERKNHKDFVIGKIGNNEVVMQQCGIGKVNSTIGAVEMIDNYHPDLVISSGVAGGADINLNVTEVVVATECVYHDAYCGDECEFGQILGMPATFKTPKEYVEKALSAFDVLESETGAGNDFLGWKHLPSETPEELVKACEDVRDDWKSRNVDLVVVIGIGGSLLAHLCPPSPIENPRILRRHVFAVIGSLYVCRTRTIFLA